MRHSIPTLCILLSLPFYTLAALPVGENPAEEKPPPPVEFPPERPVVPQQPNTPKINPPPNLPSDKGSHPDLDDVAQVLYKLRDLIKELIESSIELSPSTTSAAPASPTAISSDDNPDDNNNYDQSTITPTATSTITGHATGCASAQDLFSSCSLAFSASNLGTDFASAPASIQASCLCYSSATPSPLFAASIFDGYASECNAYLGTISLPATTTFTPTPAGSGTSSAEVVVATNARAQVSGLVRFCSRAGDVRATGASGTAASSSPTSGGVSWREGSDLLGLEFGVWVVMALWVH